MANFIYQSLHGHIVVNVHGRFCLLDTGSPFSLGREPIAIAGREFAVQECYLGITCDYLSQHIGTEIEGLIGGRVLRLFFDTGAPLSYLLPGAFAGREPDGRHEDFYPLLGNFLTNVYHLPVSLGGQRLNLRFGELPEELHHILNAGGVQGILGTEVLRHAGLCLAAADGVMTVERTAMIDRPVALG